ncbi:hypothetical protein ACLOJK_031377 [Asimina triloba]
MINERVINAAMVSVNGTYFPPFHDPSVPSHIHCSRIIYFLLSTLDDMNICCTVEQKVTLAEGRVYCIGGLVPLYTLSNVIHLQSKGSTTTWQPLPPSAVEFFEPFFRPRKSILLSNLGEVPLASEFDTAAVIVYAGDPYLSGNQKKQWVFVADGSEMWSEMQQEGPSICLLAICFSSSINGNETFVPVEPYTAGSTVIWGLILWDQVHWTGLTVAFCDLIKQPRDPGNDLWVAEATENSACHFNFGPQICSHLKDAIGAASKWAKISSPTDDWVFWWPADRKARYLDAANWKRLQKAEAAADNNCVFSSQLVMAAALTVRCCLGTLPPRRLSTSSRKPIQVMGNPSTFVSAPDRRIVAGLGSSIPTALLLLLFFRRKIPIPFLEFSCWNLFRFYELLRLAGLSSTWVLFFCRWESNCRADEAIFEILVGDLHGDLAQTRRALEIAGVLSSDGRDLWTGKETVLIQVGDILDRGEDEIAILSLLHSLSIQAEANGGAVFQVHGNHETMNVEGDFRYVDHGAFEECIDFLEYLNEHDGNWDEALVGWVNVSERLKEERRMSKSNWDPWKLVKFLLLGIITICSILEETLEAVGAKGMVVGHTPQIEAMPAMDKLEALKIGNVLNFQVGLMLVELCCGVNKNFISETDELMKSG